MKFFDLFKRSRADAPPEAVPSVAETTPAVSAEPPPSPALYDPPNPGTTSEPLAIHAKDLWQAFHDNQVAAELAYLDRPLLVSGEVDHVDRDHKDRIRVYFKVSIIYTLVVLFPNEASGAVAALRPGQAIRLVLRVAGVDCGHVVLEPAASDAPAPSEP